MELKERVERSLKEIIYPGIDKDIVTLGIVKSIEISGDSASIELDLRSDDADTVKNVENAVRDKLNNISGINSVTVQNTAANVSSSDDDAYLPRVKYKIAIASGKGGVGKSTVSVNLAVALAKQGIKVGLLDSDIYGPSIPLMFGIEGRPDFNGKKLIPIEKYGVKLMSLGFLLTDDSPVIWRGPLVMRALQQLMSDVEWGELDVILFDMPPGTGDAQLTLSQSIALDGAIIVSTPQDVALLDAVKGVQMFQKVNVPILGIIENMSYFICQHCNERTDIFSSDGVSKECDRLNVDFLGGIPLDVEIRIGGDEGIPVVEKNPDNDQSKAFMEISKKISASI
jgi:ATP-binding protein involved in chromosome partitioning